MFPLINRDEPNPLDLFQIWLNLPARNKLVEPHFAMFWRDDVPVLRSSETAGHSVAVTVIAGQLAGLTKLAPPPPPKSWGADPSSDLAIWIIKLGPGATFTVPATKTGVSRTLYFFRGAALHIASQLIPARSGVKLRADRDATIASGPEESELLLLQGRPIGEPVAQYGPFVMNSQIEVQQAFLDYRRTEFGGWSWPSRGPVHARDAGRFARYPDGRIEHAF
jgi:redox-sensitive bicupin YhaK (pirin superfamily)